MAALPEPIKSLRAALEKLAERVRRLENRSPFFGTGISPTGNGGMESDDFDGDLDAGDAGTKGWAFNSFRVAIGELLLRPGSIGNDTLTNPVMPQNVFMETSSSFPLTPAWSHLLTATITVPEGFTMCQVIALARVYAVNTTAAVDDVYGLPVVAGFSPGAYATPCSAGGYGYSDGQISRLLTGLTSGSTFTITCDGSTTTGNWSAHAVNSADLSAQLLWMR